MQNLKNKLYRPREAPSHPQIRRRIDYSGKHGNVLKGLRIALILMSALSAVVGLALCCLGIWILSCKSKIMSVLNLIDKESLPMLEKYKKDVEQLIVKYDIISRVSLAVMMLGFVTMVISAIGIYGTIKSSRLFLLAFTIILGVLLSSFLILLTILALSKDRIHAEAGAKMFLLQNKYFISLVGMVKNPDTVKGLVTVALNFMQVFLKCCGVWKVGDARNSTSWLDSERRIMKLLEEGVLLGSEAQENKGKPKPKGKATTKPKAKPTKPTRPKPRQKRNEELVDDFLDTSTNSDVPDWLKFDVPSKVMKGKSVPEKLPGGYNIDEAVFEDIVDTVSDVATDVGDAIAEVIDESLTLRTPVTCCQLDGIKKLLENNFDLQLMYDNLQDMSCVLEARNFGVNKVTCYKALWDKLMTYVTPVLALAGILITLLVRD